MSERAIPETLESEVYDLARLGKSSREILAWLAMRHDLRVSHHAVLSCLRRVAREQRELEEAVLADSEANPAEMAGIDPVDWLIRLYRDLEMVARRAKFERRTEVALRARLAQLKIADRLLKHREHQERLACRPGLKNISVNRNAENPPNTLPNAASH